MFIAMEGAANRIDSYAFVNSWLIYRVIVDRVAAEVISLFFRLIG